MAGVDYIQENPNFIEEGMELLLNQFENSTTLKTILEIAMEGEQEFQSLLVQLAEETTLNNAVGEQLDEIGLQMGVGRTTDDDEQYRGQIRLAGYSRSHEITREGTLELLRRVVGDTEAEVYNGLYHLVEVAIQAVCYDENVSDPSSIYDLMPLNTNLRIVKAEGALFGFEGSPSRNLGFSTVTNRESGGGLPSIAFRTDTRG